MKDETLSQSTVLVRIAKIGYIFIAAMLCALGIIQLADPGFPAETFSIICGVVLITFGCVRLLGFCSKDLFRLAFQYDLEFGILLVIIGIFTLACPGSFMSVTCILFGVTVLIDGLFRIRTTVEAKKFGIEKWKILMAAAIVSAVVGGILVFYYGENPEIVLGITLIAEGLLNLITALSLIKIVKNQLIDDPADFENE